MKTTIAIFTSVLLAFATGAVASDSGEVDELLSNHGCGGCHTKHSDLVGPSFNDLAAHYEGTEDAREQMLEGLREGASGTFGDTPMPPQAHVDDEDLEKIVDWILTLQ